MEDVKFRSPFGEFFILSFSFSGITLSQILIYINSISFLKIFEKFSSTIFRIFLNVYYSKLYIIHFREEIRKFEMHTHTYGQSWKISKRLHGRLSTEFQVKLGALGLWTWNWIINSAWRWETRRTRRVSAQRDAIRLKTLNRGTLSKQVDYRLHTVDKWKRKERREGNRLYLVE